MDSGSELNKFIYCLINVGIVFLSVYLRRRIFIVFGAAGILGYLSHLAWRVFKDSYAFPMILALIGIAMLYIGVQYQKNKKDFEAVFEKYLPQALLKWRPVERA